MSISSLVRSPVWRRSFLAFAPPGTELLRLSPRIAAELLAFDPRGTCSRVIAAVDGAGARLGRVGVVGLAVAPVAVFVLLGLVRGDYAFIADRCARPVREGQPVAVVFGYPGSYAAAVALRGRAPEVGFVGTATGFDHCGWLRVALTGVPSPRVGREMQDEARPVRLFPVIVGG